LFRAGFSAGGEKSWILPAFLPALFLWVFNFAYSPGPVLVFLTFVFTGLFVAYRTIERGGLRTVSLGANPKVGFVSVLALVFFLVGALVVSYGVSKRYVSALSFQRAVRAANEGGSIDEVLGLAKKAIAVSPVDLYYRFLVEVEIARLQNIIAAAGQTLSVESARTEFQRVYAEALDSAQKAIALNDAAYENHLTLARLYELLVPVGITGAYENADRVYRAAASRNPTNPGISLMQARLELTKGDRAAARRFIAEALRKKNNYTDAVFLLSQIDAADGNTPEAIRSATAATILAPGEPLVFFQLGILQYTAGDFAAAATALEQATALNPSYANAKYFLGLAYYRLGRRQDATSQFRDLTVTNPDNAEVKLILENLEKGRDPFANARPPVDSRPERRSTLPVSETRRGE
jgi:tetratricopeptide (TPR) repeat protein